MSIQQPGVSQALHVAAAICWLAMTAASGGPWHDRAAIVRGIYTGGEAVDTRVWHSYGRGYSSDRAEKHGGRKGLRCENATGAEAHGAMQSVRLDQKKTRPIIVAGWAKLEEVPGQASYHCSVYLDLTLEGGKSWPMKIAAFDPTKKGWQYVEKIYTPPAPIASARVYVFLREKKGRAWFDDIYVGQILDEDGHRSANLLKAPGFESSRKARGSIRDAYFAKLSEIGCNALHIYRGVSWQKVMGPGEVPPPDPQDPLLGFIREAHRRGFKVWLTAGLGLPALSGPDSAEFPFWPCVNNRWGQAYSRALVYFAQFGPDGLGMVPDEWTFTMDRAKSRYSKHAHPEVAKFFKAMSSYCDCPVCRTQFKKQFRLPYPDPHKAWGTANPVWAAFTQFRYASTSDWIRRSVEAVKQINPKIMTDTMICVLPVCSDNRLAAGAAWDQIGASTGLNYLQTDPYLFLHNYLGDSTHYYATETAIHLAAANWNGRAGVTLESCRLRDKYRKKDPVEVYGAALSCLAHGAREFFWWHFNYLTGKSDFVEPDLPSGRVAAAYTVMRKMEKYLAHAAPPGEILVLYSRASEDTWDWLARAGRHPKLMGEKPDRRRGFLAHKNVLYFLLRRGFPFRMTYLDNPNPARLKEARVCIIPFPFALSESETAQVEKLARSGKTVLLLSALSPVDASGNVLPEPRLQDFFAGARQDNTAHPFRSVALGQGKVIDFGQDFSSQLFEPVEPMRDPQGRVPLAPFSEANALLLTRTINENLGGRSNLLPELPAQDIETALLRGRRGYSLLAINWDTKRNARVNVQLPVSLKTKRATGYAITADAKVSKVALSVRSGFLPLNLASQQAMLIHFH